MWGGKNLVSVFDSLSGEYKLVKKMTLKNITHHLTSLDYNDYTQKILVGTLNEKVQILSADKDNDKIEVLKLRDNPAGHFLLEYENRSAVFDLKFTEKDGSKWIVLWNNGFYLCDLEQNR